MAYLDLDCHVDVARRIHTLAHGAVREIGDVPAEAIVLRALGLVELRSGRCDAAAGRLREALERQAGTSMSYAITAAYLAAAHAADGRPDEAVRLGDEIPGDAVPALPLLTLGHFLLRGARPRDAQRYLHRASVAADGPVRVRALHALAEVCRAVGADDDADEHAMQAAALSSATGYPAVRASGGPGAVGVGPTAHR